jgi:hypothetical protein
MRRHKKLNMVMIAKRRSKCFVSNNKEPSLSAMGARFGGRPFLQVQNIQGSFSGALCVARAFYPA